MKQLNNLPNDITMVGGTMPGLMFYAGFMQELFSIFTDIKLNSISGTSAGAAIGALAVVGKHQEAPKILLDQFGDDTGVAGYGVFGKKTIQGNLKTIVQEHVSPEELLENDTTLKTLHTRISKGPFMKMTEGMKYKETIWLIQNLLKYSISKLGTSYGSHEIFDSSTICSEHKDKVLELLSGSFQYSPDNSSEAGELLTDGEFGSWHESSGTVNELNQDLSKQGRLLVLTRFPKGENGYDAIVTQTAKLGIDEVSVVGPSQELAGNFISTSPEHMQHNLEVGKKTARLYVDALIYN